MVSAGPTSLLSLLLLDLLLTFSEVARAGVKDADTTVESDMRPRVRDSTCYGQRPCFIDSESHISHISVTLGCILSSMASRNSKIW